VPKWKPIGVKVRDETAQPVHRRSATIGDRLTVRTSPEAQNMSRGMIQPAPLDDL
jgi:hypothetical protein